MVENSRTSSRRLKGVPSWYQVPSRAMRMSMSPQWVGFHRSTGGRVRPAAESRCRLARPMEKPPEFDLESAPESPIEFAIYETVKPCSSRLTSKCWALQPEESD